MPYWESSEIKCIIWEFKTVSRNWTLEFPEPVYSQVALKEFYDQTGISANSVLMQTGRNN